MEPTDARSLSKLELAFEPPATSRQMIRHFMQQSKMPANTGVMLA